MLHTSPSAIATSSQFNKADQTGFHFAQNSLTVGYVLDKKISNTATGGEGTGAITYSIDKKAVAIIDDETGELTIKSAGTATITAIRAADANYNAISNSYLLTVNGKQDQTGFSFAQDSITTIYAADATISNVCQRR